MKLLLLFAVICILMYGIYIYYRDRELLNPVLVFICPICISLTINLLYYDPLYKISTGTYAIYFISVISFILGLSIGRRTRIFKIEDVNRPLYLRYNVKLYNLYWFISLLGVFFAIRQIIAGQSYGMYEDNLIDNTRYYTQYVHSNNFFAEYGYVFADTLLLISSYKIFILNNTEKRDKQQLFMIFIMNIIYMATSFSRTTILNIFSVFLFFFISKSLKNIDKKKKKKLIVKTGIIIAFILWSCDFIANKTSKAIGKTGESWWLFYFGSQFYIFDKDVLNINARMYGRASLGIIGRIMAKLNLFPTEGALIVGERFKQNGHAVASFIMGPYIDFGILGSIIIMILYGIIIGYIYKRCIKTRGIWIIYYATCVPQCLLAFYAFTFGKSNQVYDIILISLLIYIRGKKDIFRLQASKNL